jgi:hypothetical protein
MEIDSGGREGISQVRAGGGVGDNIVEGFPKCPKRCLPEKVPGPIYL